MASSPDYEKTPFIDEEETEYESTGYIPGAPPDYLTALNLDHYGPPKYEAPLVEGTETCEEETTDQEEVARKLNLPRLAYVDFLPYCFKRGDKQTGLRPVFDTFRGVFSYANSWLSSNRMYQVVNIEGIERRVGFDGQVDSGATIEHTASHGLNGILRGVRLWLIPNPDPASPPQVICYFNWLPKEDPIKREVLVRHGFLGPGSFLKEAVYFPNFKPMSHTVNKLNECISQRPIPGTVMTVQTLELLYQESWGKKCLDPDLSSFFSVGNKPKLYLNYLRIFYVAGTPKVHKIGIMDFAPVVTYKSKSINAQPRFEEFKDVFQRASGWIYHNDAKAVKVTNIQNISFKIEQRSLSGSSAGDVIVDSDVTWYRAQGYSYFVKVVRVAYLELDEPENRQPIPMTSRLFLPVRTAPKTAETLPETLFRINAWLNITGIPVFSVETEKFLFSPDVLQTPVKPDQMAVSVCGDRGVYTVSGIRLYLVGNYQEPNPAFLPPEFSYVTHVRQGGTTCCTVS